MTGAVRQTTYGGLSIANTGPVGGDFRVNVDSPMFTVVPFPTAMPEVDELRHRGPSALLQATSRVVDFVGRKSELADLTAWLRGPTPSAVMLIHGRGGQGKTRLAAKLAEQAAAEGWMVGEARHRAESAATELDGDLLVQGCGLLTILDYAERWPHSDLKHYLLAGPRHRKGPTRVLLVARPSGLWWNMLEHPLRKGSVETTEFVLGPLATSVADRRVSFVAARDRFAEILGATRYSGLQPAGSLAVDAYGLVLTLHMAALVAVDAHMRGTAPPADPGELSAYLLERENDSWATMFESRRIGVTPQLMRRMVGLATLVGPTAFGPASDLVQTAGLADGPAAAQHHLDDHAACYPTDDGRLFLKPLLPDRLGEDFIARLLSSQDDTAGAWCAQLVERLVAAGSDDEPAKHASSALTVLVETARRWEPVRRDHLFPLLRRLPRLAVMAGGASLVTLAEFADHDVLQALEPHLPGHRDPDLDAGIAMIARRLTEFGLQQTRDDLTLGLLYKRLGIRLSHAGLHEDALDATAKAVAAFRVLARTAPDVAESDLGQCLNNLSVHLYRVGRPAQALAVAEEALRICRRLAEARPDAFTASLASSWNNFSLIASASGQHESALAAAQAAAALYQQLAATQPGAFLPDLAGARNNLGMLYAERGQHAEALVLAEDTERTYGLLADAIPEYAPDHALALSNLAARYHQMGRFTDAATAGERAATIFGRLAATNEGAYLPDLATALNNLGNFRADVGRLGDAQEAAAASVAIYRRLDSLNPAAHRPDLARALANLASRVSALGAHEEALGLADEAVQAYERLVAETPGHVEPDLADALVNQSAILARLRRQRDGAAAIKRALAIYRELVATNPQAHRPRLARVLTNFGMDLTDAGQYEEALHTTEEAVEILRDLYQADPAAYEPDLAHAVNNLARPLTELGRAAAALDATREAVTIRTRLAGRNPARFEPELALSLSNLGLLLRDLKQPAPASDAAAQAVEIHRRLAEEEPARFLSQLAWSLLIYGTVHSATPDGTCDAERALHESATIYTGLAEAAPDTFGPYVSLADRALAGLRRPDDPPPSEHDE